MTPKILCTYAKLKILHPNQNLQGNLCLQTYLAHLSCASVSSCCWLTSSDLVIHPHVFRDGCSRGHLSLSPVSVVGLGAAHFVHIIIELVSITENKKTG